MVKHGHLRTAPSVEFVVKVIELRIALVALDLPDIHHVMHSRLGGGEPCRIYSMASPSEPK